MQKDKSFFALLALLLTSCTSIPDIPLQYSVSVADVVNNVRCELRDASAISPYMKKKKGWSAGVDLELIVSTTAGFDASASLTGPSTPEVLLVSAGGSHSAQAKRLVNLNFIENLQEPGKIPCNKLLKTRSGGQLLNGSLGIIEWVEVINKTIRDSNIPQPNEFNKFAPRKVGTNIEFTIVWKGNLGPSISAVPVGRSSVKAGLNVTGDRSAVHRLSILLTPTPEEKPSGKARVEEQIQRDLLNQTLRSREDDSDSIQ